MQMSLLSMQIQITHTTRCKCGLQLCSTVGIKCYVMGSLQVCGSVWDLESVLWQRDCVLLLELAKLETFPGADLLRRLNTPRAGAQYALYCEFCWGKRCRSLGIYRLITRLGLINYQFFSRENCFRKVSFFFIENGLCKKQKLWLMMSFLTKGLMHTTRFWD